MPSSQSSAASSALGSPRAGPMQPNEATDSYFPQGAIASSLTSHSSSIESPLSNSSLSLDYPLSPLDRQYAKPEKELDIAEQLAKQPTYWSVKGWVQRSATTRSRPLTEDAATRARKFEEAKKDLLASLGRF